MKVKKQKRFTLIEIIIVIITIGILAGMALPKFIDVKRQAEHAKLLNNMDAVQEATQICYLENDKYPVYLHKVDFYSLNDVVQSQIINNGETGEQIYKVKVNDSSVATLSSLLSSVFATDSDDPGLETDTFHTKLKYGLGKYGVNDYYLYSEETGRVYYANGNLMDDSDSSITPITKDGTYYMTVNAGDIAIWIDHYSEEYIPDGGSITYEWAATDNKADTRDNSKLNWTSDFSSLPHTQYLKTKITIKSPEGGDQTKLYKYRVQYLTDDESYEELPITPNMIKTKDVIQNPDGTYSPSGTSSSSGGTSSSSGGSGGAGGSGGSGGAGGSGGSGGSVGSIQITIPSTSGINGIFPNIPGVDYNDITISSPSGSDPYGPSGKHPLSDIGKFSDEPVTVTFPVYPGKPITIPSYFIAIKDELDWQTIDALTFECDAMETTQWTGFDYTGFIPENTRLIVYFSTSNDDTKWSSETQNISNVANSEYIKAKILLQKNQYAKQNPTLSEVFFDNYSGGKTKRVSSKTPISSIVYNEDTIKQNMPTAIITMNPSSDLYTNTNITFDYSNSTVPNNESIINHEWKVDNESIDNPNTIYSGGTHTIALRVQNEDYLWSNWVTQDFYVNEHQKPNAVISINPTNTTIYNDTSMTFDYSNSTDPNNGKIINAEWQIDDEDITNPNGTYNTGTHKVSLRVENEYNLWSDWVTQSFDVENHQPPTAKITINPTTCYETSNITFDYSKSTDPINAKIINYQWKIDGVDTTNPNGTYAAGAHTISLKVENQYNLWSNWVSQNFNVYTITTFVYTGNVQKYTVPSGVTQLQLDVWGAQGSNSAGGRGGYATGTLNVTSGQVLYIYVGGTDGYNGGGQGNTPGGGATDIRIGGTNLTNRIIVAGGGGGVGYGVAGAGGGLIGISGTTTYGGYGGTQTSGGYGGNIGSLGKGGNSYVSSRWTGPGGGGYYGGGSGRAGTAASVDYFGAGGGGSSYIGGVSNGSTIAGNTTMPAPNGTTETGQGGNGYAKVTPIG